MEEIVREKRYEFRGKLVPIVHTKIARKMLSMLDGDHSLINFTLNRYSPSEVFREGDQFIVKFGEKEFVVSEKDLLKVVKKEKKLFYINESGLIPLEIRKEHYYKLVLPPRKYYPTIEIDGIHMHRIKDMDPLTDSKMKVSALKGRRERILDICTGLGYTAILAKKNAKEVITIEKDENVLSLAEYNPWSQDLAVIPIIKADASEIIRDFPSNYFNGVIHDPPRFSLAGELYSQDFYNELFRVLKKRGILFHYTGKPHAKYRGKSLIKGIGERLTRAGFRVKFDERKQGFVGIKK